MSNIIEILKMHQIILGELEELRMKSRAEEHLGGSLLLITDYILRRLALPALTDMN